MYSEFDQLDGWHQYPQSPHINQLKLLSESMDYAPKILVKVERKLLPTLHNLSSTRQVTEIRTPRRKSLNHSRHLSNQLQEKLLMDSPLRQRKQNLEKMKIEPSQFNFVVSEQRFDENNKEAPKDLFQTKEKIKKLAPILQKVQKISLNNRIITITQKSPLAQLQKLLDVLNEK